jgi:ABC-type lipoprotein export system ATPase subunit
MNLRINALTKRYGEFEILKNINYEFKKGNFYVITGKSGCGKTTLLNILSLSDFNYEGDVFYGGEKVDINNAVRLRKKIAVLLQSSYMINDLTVEENINLIQDKFDKKSYEELSVRLEISELFDKKTKYLSVGQKQRANMFRAFIRKPEIIFADEPVASLDYEGKLKIMNCLRKFVKENETTVIMITHDKNIIDKNDITLCLRDGNLFEL